MARVGRGSQAGSDESKGEVCGAIFDGPRLIKKSSGNRTLGGKQGQDQPFVV